MAASVRIEDEAFSDVRYDVLALTCNLADSDHARGKMAKLWRQCTQQQTRVLPESVCVSVLGPNALEGLETSALGEQVEGGIRICGTKGRIEWLGKLRKNAQKGGKAKAAKRQANGSQKASKRQEESCQERPKTLPPPFPPAPAPAPAPAEKEIQKGGDSAPLVDVVPRGNGQQEMDAVADPAASNPKAKRAPSSDFQRVVAAVSDGYSTRYGGARHTWGEKQGGQVKQLLKQHSADEVVAKAEHLFTDPPSWLRDDESRFDLGTLVANFDRLGRGAKPSNGEMPDWKRRQLEELEKGPVFR